ncbi:OmpH family outer membrane protein [Hymenobacter lapidarius]|nr:OmpH family outer membrane protein [Hymenobacter lapidarius]
MYNKKSLLVIVCVLSLTSACKSQLSSYIRPNYLFAGYNGARLRQQVMLNKREVWQSNLDSLTDEMTSLPDNQAKAKRQEFLQYRQAIEQKIQVEEARINQEILAEINLYIKQYGKNKGYDFILGATENGNIVYAAEGKDITEDVLNGLNNKYDQEHPNRP